VTSLEFSQQGSRARAASMRFLPLDIDIPWHFSDSLSRHRDPAGRCRR
jgi:hypothetical protein